MTGVLIVLGLYMLATLALTLYAIEHSGVRDEFLEDDSLNNEDAEELASGHIELELD